MSAVLVIFLIAHKYSVGKISATMADMKMEIISCILFRGTALQSLYNFLGGDILKHRDKKCEKQWANEFDQLEAASKEIQTPSAPPGEFDSILAEMNRRGIKPRIRKELKHSK